VPANQSEGSFESRPHRVDVPGLAEDHGDDDPVVRGARRTVRSGKSPESAALVGGDVGCLPGRLTRGVEREWVGEMLEVSRRDQAAGRNFLGRSSHGDAIHDRPLSCGKPFQGELVLGRNRGGERKRRAVQVDGLPGRQGTEGDAEVVTRIKSEGGCHGWSEVRCWIARMQEARTDHGVSEERGPFYVLANPPLPMQGSA